MTIIMVSLLPFNFLFALYVSIYIGVNIGTDSSMIFYGTEGLKSHFVVIVSFFGTKLNLTYLQVLYQKRGLDLLVLRVSLFNSQRWLQMQLIFNTLY